jgi:hypothetical protein
MKKKPWSERLRDLTVTLYIRKSWSQDSKQAPALTTSLCVRKMLPTCAQLDVRTRDEELKLF